MRKEIFDKDLIEKYRGENGWIPNCFKPEQFLIEDEKSRKEISVLVSLKNNRVSVVRRIRWGDNPNCWEYSRGLGSSIVAWQPLPPLYKRGK